MRVHIIITQDNFKSGSPSNCFLEDEADNLYRYTCREVDQYFVRNRFIAQYYYNGASYLHDFVMEVTEVPNKELFLKKLTDAANAQKKFLTESEFVRIIAGLKNECQNENSEMAHSYYNKKGLTTFTKKPNSSASVQKINHDIDLKHSRS